MINGDKKDKGPDKCATQNTRRLGKGQNDQKSSNNKCSDEQPIESVIAHGNVVNSRQKDKATAEQ